MSTPAERWKAHDAHLEQSATTDFTQAQEEIDARLAADAPEHPDSIELRRILQQSERASEVATAMLLILEMALPGEASISPRTARQIGYRVIVLLHLLQSSRAGIGSVGMATLARKLSVTRALLSHYARFWNKATGLRARGQKMAGTSEEYRAGAKRGWIKRRGLPVEDAMEHQHIAESFPQAEKESDDEELQADDIIPSWQRGRGESFDDDAALMD